MKRLQIHRKSSIYILLSLAAFAAASLSSCATLTALTANGSGEDDPIAESAPADPESGTGKTGGQPEWTRKTPKSAEFLYVTGYGKVTDRTTSTKRAIADGKDQISRWLETKVQSILLSIRPKPHRPRIAVNETALEVSRSVSRASISRHAESALVDADGGVWCS